MDFIILDSFSHLTTAHKGMIVVCGSHGGISAAKHALSFAPRAIFCSDGGKGKDDAGIQGLWLLDAKNIPASAVSVQSARIGDGKDVYENGLISFVNKTAQSLGIATGMRVIDAVELVKNGKEIMALPLKVAGLGLYFPRKRETRDQFVKRGIPNEIIEDLGIYERRLIGEKESIIDMEVKASKAAIKNAGLQPSDIDLIMSATILPEMIGIPNSNQLQFLIGANKAAAFDLCQACGTLIPGMIIAANFIAAGQYERILLTASTNWSAISDSTQPSADFVLGDGAGAMVLTASKLGYGILSFDMQTNGKFYQNCGIRMGHDHTTKYYDKHNKKLLFFIDNKGIESSKSGFGRYLLTNGPNSFKASLRKARLTTEDIDCAVIHGNVKPVVRGWIKGMKVPSERFPLTFNQYGNLSVVTLLPNLKKGLKEGLIKKDSTVAFVSQGAGFSAGSIIMRWE